MLRLGASTTPASYLLPRLVAEFRQAFPAVSLHSCRMATRANVERLPVLDLAFIEGDVPAGLPADTAVHAWRQDEVVAIVRADHALSGRRCDPARFAASPLVMREPGSRAAGRALPMPLTPSVAGTGGRGRVKQAVRAGLGVGFVSVMSMRHE